jgi:hypothetical protein
VLTASRAHLRFTCTPSKSRGRPRNAHEVIGEFSISRHSFDAAERSRANGCGLVTWLGL